MENRRLNKFCKAVMVMLGCFIVFLTADYILSEIADIKAYEDAEGDDSEWTVITEKINSGKPLSEVDYDEIFLQSGLGKAAVETMFAKNEADKIQEYRDYYLLDKEYYCFRKGIFACHERITDKDGEEIRHPEFADLQNGDIIVTLSIHSLGWRHGHSTIITDAENGVGVQAVMVGEKSNNTTVYSWRKYPLVAVLRPKNTSADVRNQAAEYAEDNLKGLYYSLFGGVFSGRDTEKTLKTTQCAHLVWYAYMANGIDIAPECGRIITPKDFLESERLEIVQIYGNITDLRY